MRPFVGAPPAPAPAPVYTQDQQRERRRRGFSVQYGAEFDLAAEVSAIVSPLAVQAAALRNPLAVRPRIDEVADAVQELLSAVVGMLAETRLDTAAQARVVQSVRDLAQRPREPQITDEQIISGRWAAVLTKHVAAHSTDLSVLLGRAQRPGVSRPHLPAPLSVSDRLYDALRVLDWAAVRLGRQIPAVARFQALPTPEENAAARRIRQEQERVERAQASVVHKMKGPNDDH